MHINKKQYNQRNEEFFLLNKAFDSLFPILRSITGPGLEKSLQYFEPFMPFKMEKVATGSTVFDWVVPKEWHFVKGTLTDPNGKVIADTLINNLHVVNYSQAVDKKLSLAELQPYLHSLPALPNAIPYVTSYYNLTWGFCLSDKVRKNLFEGQYHAHIESSYVDGGVPFSHCLLEGESEKEILLTSYLCHPSMANNELSGPLVLLGLYQRIKNWPKRRYSYRFLLNPETIGSLCFLDKYASHLKKNLISGMILTCLGGDQEKIRMKHSRMNDSLFDRCARYLQEKDLIRTIPFCPTGGSDERQYCSPGFNFPMLQVAKTFTNEYSGYHNSLDDKAFMSIASVQKSIDQIEQFLLMAEKCGHPVNQSPFGEPQLGKRNLYPTLNSNDTRSESSDNFIDNRWFLNALLITLNASDGALDLFEIAQKVGCEVESLYPVITRLEDEGLIKYGVEVPKL
jgi:aminopeptidase-like protein